MQSILSTVCCGNFVFSAGCLCTPWLADQWIDITTGTYSPFTKLAYKDAYLEPSCSYKPCLLSRRVLEEQAAKESRQGVATRSISTEGA